MSGTAVTHVGIAVVLHAGHVLVGVRGPDVPLPGFAEFPGGKCHPHEPPDQCAVRECAEETGLGVQPLRLMEQLEWTYPHAVVQLHFYLCRPATPVDLHAAARGFRWRPIEDLANLRFPDANAGVVAGLLAQKAAR